MLRMCSYPDGNDPIERETSMNRRRREMQEQSP